MPRLRGQVWTMDTMFAVGTYSLLLLFFLSSWNGLVAATGVKFDHEQLHYSALLVSHNLFSSGTPSAWEAAAYNASFAPGILSAPGVLSRSKLSALESLNATHYDDVRSALGAGRFHVFLNVSGTDFFGIPPDANATTYSADRLMVLSGTTVKVTFFLWR